VESGSAADRAGIEKGDLLVRAGQRDLLRVDDLHVAVDGALAGGELPIVVVRGVDEREVVVSLGGEGGA
jgi:S1-C subfamily serine protease